MASCFKLTIHTALGSISGEQDANDENQLRRCMPDDVIAFSIEGTRMRPGADVAVDDEELWLNLSYAVQNIEYASTLTPEVVAKHHEEQARALGNLCVSVVLPTDNPAMAAKLSSLFASLDKELH